MSGWLELHIGFVSGDEAHALRIAETLRNEEAGWTLSEVSEVHDHLHGMDPHNVPGTLVFLLSRTYPVTDADRLLSAAANVMGLLADVPAARLEVEFAYGEIKIDEPTKMSYPTTPTLSLPTWPNANRIRETPEYEIHFVASARRSAPLTVKELEDILGSRGIQAAQTIRYRSERMKLGLERGRKLISTVYFPSNSELIDATEQIRHDRLLIQALLEASIELTLRPERIYGCYMPSERTPS
jgi:hypothetical protein